MHPSAAALHPWDPPKEGLSWWVAHGEAKVVGTRDGGALWPALVLFWWLFGGFWHQGASPAGAGSASGTERFPFRRPTLHTWDPSRLCRALIHSIPEKNHLPESRIKQTLLEEAASSSGTTQPQRKLAPRAALRGWLPLRCALPSTAAADGEEFCLAALKRDTAASQKRVPGLRALHLSWDHNKSSSLPWGNHRMLEKSPRA